jgi:hypothetical protein
MGLKPSDYLTVPLTDSLHKDLHNHGEKSFWERHGQQPEEVIFMNLLCYAAQIRGEDISHVVEGLISSLEDLRSARAKSSHIRSVSEQQRAKASQGQRTALRKGSSK